MATKGKGNDAGMGLAAAGAVIAAALGAYFLYGPQGKKNRKEIKGWMLKAKGEVLEKVERMKEFDHEAYEKIVEQVSDKYSKVKGIEAKDVAAMVAELRSHWTNFRKEWEKAHKTKAKKTPARLKIKKDVK